MSRDFNEASFITNRADCIAPAVHGILLNVHWAEKLKIATPDWGARGSGSGYVGSVLDDVSSRDELARRGQILRKCRASDSSSRRAAR